MHDSHPVFNSFHDISLCASVSFYVCLVCAYPQTYYITSLTYSTKNELNEPHKPTVSSMVHNSEQGEVLRYKLKMWSVLQRRY